MVRRDAAHHLDEGSHQKNLEALVDTVAGEHGPERVAGELRATAPTTDVRRPRVGFRWVLEECRYETMKHKKKIISPTKPWDINSGRATDVERQQRNLTFTTKI